MKPLNHTKRRKQIVKFSLYFSLLIIVLLVCGSFTLNTATKGITLLVEKKDNYDAIFKKQAELNFQLEDIYKNLSSLKNKRRTLTEHKEMQKLISDTRLSLEKEININKHDAKNYKLYQELFNHLGEIQSIMDVYKKEESKRLHNIDQLEKCKQKYREINSNQFN
ncbi:MULTISPECIES: type VI secretion system TssO [Cellulophaga]|uniref:Uncharacterized protein n=1 Tax=Cellulophaga geojensis KL-A TaxID=1328323 RepID=A0ABN0RJP6_9FLAO|nr:MULTISPECIES: type VI secretion system TssO [Cellulophaga]APU09427.1 hypothetical protein A5M85_03760 [Cellulophaga lytica]EWH10541.1 hypothetical protein KLA_16597 [Cellulophaga geojensis KL-A]MDO6855279.1 type VI secretion system TssO [Cellulophaga lytica]SNQ45116.1 conserved exported hypothetical protein [Cellulophaga lytica]